MFIFICVYIIYVFIYVYVSVYMYFNDYFVVFEIRFAAVAGYKTFLHVIAAGPYPLL